MNDLEKIKQELEELKAKSKELQDKIDELMQAEQQSEQLKRCRVKENECYYYIESDAEYITLDYELGGKVDQYRYNIGNYFRTEEEGKKMLEKLKIYMQLKDLALRLNKGKKIDWSNNNQKKHIIVYPADKLQIFTTLSYRLIGQIYCLDENFLKEAKQEIGEENLIKLFE